MSKQKIIYIVTRSNWGGAQRYVFDLATAKENRENEIIVAHGGAGLMSEKLDGEEIRRIRIEELDRDISIFDELKVVKRMIDIFYQEKPDIVHLNSSKVGGLGAVAGRIAGVKNIIFTVHGLPHNEDRPAWQKLIIKGITYFTMLLSHKNIIISKRELEQIKDWFWIKKKIEFIHNGIHDIDFLDKQEAREILQDKLKIEDIDNCLWIGTISELTKNKGLKYAIKAINKLVKNMGNKWNGIFMIIGSGEDRGYLEHLIEKYNLENRVYLTGFIEDASTYLKAFDIFLLSSVKEGLPYVLLESGLAENAVVSTDVGGIREIVDDMDTGVLIRSKDKKEISNALSFYIKSEKHRDEFGKKLREKILKEFNVEKMIEKTLKLY